MSGVISTVVSIVSGVITTAVSAIFRKPVHINDHKLLGSYPHALIWDQGKFYRAGLNTGNKKVRFTLEGRRMGRDTILVKGGELGNNIGHLGPFLWDAFSPFMQNTALKFEGTVDESENLTFDACTINVYHTGTRAEGERLSTQLKEALWDFKLADE